MADFTTIKSYLVGLGFRVDQRSLSQFNETLKKAASHADESIGKIGKSAVLGAATAVGAFASITAGLVGLADHVAQNDLDMQLFARRMFLSTDAARKMKTATDALGYSVEEIVWGPPELAERYRALIADQNKMLKALGGADFEKQTRNLRDIRFEFTRLGVEMKYFSMLVVSDLSKALFGDETSLLKKLQQFSDWFMDNMPRIAQEIATKIAPTLKELGQAFGQLFTTLSHVDWASLLNSLAKLTEYMVKTLNYILSNPVLAQTLLGAGVGAVGGSIVPGVGTALGALGGATFGLVYGATGKLLNQSTGQPATKSDIRKQIAAAAAAAGVDPALALAVAQQESGFNPRAVNKQTGATGLFQLMPGTASMLGVDINDPNQNIAGGVRYLHDLLAKHKGDVGAALKEYGGFVNADPSSYISNVERMRGQYQSGAQPISYHYTTGDVRIDIAQPNATPEQIHKAVRDGMNEHMKRQIAVLIAEQQGVFA